MDKLEQNTTFSVIDVLAFKDENHLDWPQIEANVTEWVNKAYPNSRSSEKAMMASGMIDQLHKKLTRRMRVPAWHKAWLKYHPQDK